MTLARTRFAHQPLTLFALLWGVASAPADASADLTALSLEQLLDVTIVDASKYEQKQGEVAAAVSVITRQEIQSFGWRPWGGVLAGLPGEYPNNSRQTRSPGRGG